MEMITVRCSTYWNCKASIKYKWFLGGSKPVKLSATTVAQKSCIPTYCWDNGYCQKSNQQITRKSAMVTRTNQAVNECSQQNMGKFCVLHKTDITIAVNYCLLLSQFQSRTMIDCFYCFSNEYIWKFYCVTSGAGWISSFYSFNCTYTR